MLSNEGCYISAMGMMDELCGRGLELRIILICMKNASKYDQNRGRAAERRMVS